MRRSQRRDAVAYDTRDRPIQHRQLGKVHPAERLAIQG